MVAKLSSVRIIVAASRATSVPERPMATPMSARRSAGASLTPSPVMATTWPAERSASAMRSLASGELRAKTTSVPEPSSSSSSRFRHRVQFGAGDHLHPAGTAADADLAGDRGGGQPVVAGDHVDADASPVHRAIAAGTSGRGGSSMAAIPVRHRSRSASSRSAGDADPAGSIRRANGQHPQAPPGVAGHDARGLVAVGGGERHVAVAAADPGDPGQDLLGRALGVHHQAAVLARRRWS